MKSLTPAAATRLFSVQVAAARLFSERGTAVAARGAPIAWLTLTGSMFVVLSVGCAQAIAAAGDLWIDYGFYHDLGARWLADGTYYLPHQLAGPYQLSLMIDVLYPPSALLLFVPFSIAPPILWWAIPIGVTLFVVRGWSPSTWVVGAALLLLAWPRATGAFLYGNTDIWAMAAIAAGLRWGWPAVFVVLKPSLALLALVGIAHRSWWVGLLAFVVLVPATIGLWWDYLVVLTNVRGLGSDYSLGSVPLLLVPVVLWAGRRRQHAPHTG